MNTIKHQSTESQKRLAWAIARVLIALLSTAFFCYFFATSIQDYVRFQEVTKQIELSVDISDLVIYSSNEITAIRAYYTSGGSIDEVESTQQITYKAFYAVLEKLRTDLTVNRVHVEVERLIVQSNIYFTVIQPLVLNKSIALSNVTDVMHEYRTTVIQVLARIATTEEPNISNYLSTLVPVLFYREILGSERDAAGKLVTASADEIDIIADTMVQYAYGAQLYKRETEQVLREEFNDLWYGEMNKTTYRDAMARIVEARTHKREANFSSYFSSKQWNDDYTVILLAARPIRTKLRELILSTKDDYNSYLDQRLAVAFIGILIELIAAFTLIYQALPVLVMYVQFSAAIKESSSLSKASPKDQSKGDKKSVDEDLTTQ